MRAASDVGRRPRKTTQQRGSEVYAYNAAMYCDYCARKIMEGLDGADLEDTGDTNEYPQRCSDSEESDCPEHCDGCGEFLENSLTSDGADYVIEAVRDDLEAGRFDSVACTVWRDFYHWFDFPTWGACACCGEEGMLTENDDYDEVCELCLNLIPDCHNCDGTEGCSGRCYRLPFTD